MQTFEEFLIENYEINLEQYEKLEDVYTKKIILNEYVAFINC